MNKKIKPLDFLSVSTILYIAGITVFADTSSIFIKFVRILLVFAFLCFIVFSKNKLKILNAYTSGQLIFLTLCFLSIFWSVSRDNTIRQSMTLMYVVLANIIICFALQTKQIMTFAMKAIIFGGILHGLLIYGENGFLVYLNTRGGNDLENANTLAFTASFAAIFSFILIKKRLVKNMNIYKVAFFICIIFAVLTGSKKALIYLFVFFAVYYILKSANFIKSIFNVVVIAIIFLGICYFVLNNSFLYAIIGSRFETMISGFAGESTDASTSFRLELIDWGLEWAQARPVQGYGLDCFRYMLGASHPNLWTGAEGVYAHNNYIELLVDLGIIGVVCYYWIYLYIIYKGIKSYKSNMLQSTFAIALILSSAVAEYGQISYFNPFLQCVILIAYALVANMPYQNEIK